MLRYLAVVALLSGPAVAEESNPHRVAVAVNTPLSWALPDWNHEGAIGITAWVGLNEHQAIRANFATYDPDFHPINAVLGNFSECPPEGNTKDVGASWEYFPRALYSGVSLELGLLRRSTTQAVNNCDPLQYIDTNQSSVTYAARAMVGWSWTIGNHAFIAFAVGSSKGLERGIFQRREDHFAAFETLPVDQWTSSLETYLRFGAAI
jgi:hypothetical protein